MFTHRSASKVKANISSTTKTHLIRGAFYVLLLLTGTLLVYSRPAASTKVSPRTLTFAERVAYQRALEEVYWRHRIWPKERPDPKPSLDAVFPRAQLEKKVQDYLGKSQMLEDYWQQPITAEQLQAEVDRMAKHTKQPDVLRELFAVLGNDPFVIAECLARPALADRLLRSWYTHDQGIHGELRKRVEAESWLFRGKKELAVTVPATTIGYSLPKILDTADSCIDDTWTALPGPPDGRIAHTAVWTGSEMIIWGGNEYLNTGGRYNPTTDSWTPTSNTNAPTPRDYHTAVWTGSEMIIWGGYNETAALNTGGKYNPNTDSWVATTTTNAPEGRGSHTAVWTGSQMIVWGGSSSSGYLSTGGRYNPNTDSWTATSTTNAPEGRIEGGAVWTGSEMIVWGGYFYDGNQHYLNTGGSYNPDTDSWTPTSLTNAPIGRTWHTLVWTGSEMIVWGGERAFLDPLNTGGRYNPSTDSWVATNTTNAPEARELHTAVWTGSNEMIVWGGHVNEPGGLTNTGSRYNPSTDSWTVTSTIDAPIPRDGHTAVWTGSEMLVWGGGIDSQSAFFSDDGGRYDPATDSWTLISSGNTPAARFRHTAVWTGTEMIVWGGQVGYSSYLNTGGRYIPSIDNWSGTSTTDAPSARDLHTAIWTGTEMIVWGGNEFGYPMDTGTRNNQQSAPSTPTPTPTPPIPATGGRYDPGTDTWTATSIVNAPSVRWRHTAVWTGSEMIVWGGSWSDMLGPHYYNSGGRYDPITDSWSGTSGSGVPDRRDSHSAVWTGTEMIVWGGDNGFGFVNSGGRYDPATSIWTPTSVTNVPTARGSNTAIWTGNEMIIWGGTDGTSYLNTGGRYNPSIDGWTATNTADAPTGRLGHTAVWNDSDMIIWGGQASTDPPTITFDTGGRYNPSTDSWAATSLTGVPVARSLHTAIWTGDEVIIWGGRLVSSQNTHTGARYCAQSGTPSPTPTPTASATPTSTAIPSATPTATPTPTLTPRTAPTPRVRPTPPPRP